MDVLQKPLLDPEKGSSFQIVAVHTHRRIEEDTQHSACLGMISTHEYVHKWKKA